MLGSLAKEVDCILRWHFSSQTLFQGILRLNRVLTTANSFLLNATEERQIFKKLKYVENSVGNLKNSAFDFIKFDLTELLFLSSLISSINEKWVHDKENRKKKR